VVLMPCIVRRGLSNSARRERHRLFCCFASAGRCGGLGAPLGSLADGTALEPGRLSSRRSLRCIYDILTQSMKLGICEQVRARNGGTLFLDEVSDLSLSAQAKPLRARSRIWCVERVGGGTHRVDIRVVAATNRSLLGLVDRRLFRADLYYGLSGVDIRVPALHERRADIIELASESVKSPTRALFSQGPPGDAEAAPIGAAADVLASHEV
jgi:hypothetical protein